jgi:predicted kinase
MLAQAHNQTLLLFKGHPATGKSTLANAVARQLAWPLIDKDDIKDHTYALPNGGQLAYTIMWQIVRHQLELGLSVIVDSPLSYPTSYQTGQELAHGVCARLLVIETCVPLAAWQARLDARLGGAQSHRTSGWSAMQTLLASYGGSWQYPIAPESYLTVDTTQPTAANVEKIVEFLAQPIRATPPIEQPSP